MRASALRTLGWQAIDADRLSLLKRILREHSVAALRSLPLLRTPRAARKAPRRAAAAVTRSRRR
jgi:hypothetical protein